MSKKIIRLAHLSFFSFVLFINAPPVLNKKDNFYLWIEYYKTFISVIYTFRGQARVISSCNYSLMLNSKAGTNPGPISPTFLVPMQSSFCADNF
jgi:hypothetical protein